jgi:hypothetical protein
VTKVLNFKNLKQFIPHGNQKKLQSQKNNSQNIKCKFIHNPFLSRSILHSTDYKIMINTFALRSLCFLIPLLAERELFRHIKESRRRHKKIYNKSIKISIFIIHSSHLFYDRRTYGFKNHTFLCLQVSLRRSRRN